jgi:hypothetical protein
MPGPDSMNLVLAVAVERDQGQGVLGAAIPSALASVLDLQSAPAERPGQGDDERADHVVGLLAVLVWDEELPGAVDQHRVEPGSEGGGGGQAEIGAQLCQRRDQCRVEPPLVDLHAAPRDLACVAHGEVAQSLLALPVSSRPSQLLKLPCVPLRHRQMDRSDTSDLDGQIGGPRRSLRAERAGRLEALEEPRENFPWSQRGGVHTPSLIGRDPCREAGDDADHVREGPRSPGAPGQSFRVTREQHEQRRPVEPPRRGATKMAREASGATSIAASRRAPREPQQSSGPPVDVEAEGFERGDSGRPGRAKDGEQGVVVVVDFDDGLAGRVAHDPPDVLGELGPRFDGKGEEQGVESGAVEAFAGVRPGGGDE